MLRPRRPLPLSSGSSPARTATARTGPPARPRGARGFLDRRLFQLPPLPPMPPIGTRLRPLIPFFITWTVITSLTVHLMQEKKRGATELGRAHAKETVLEALIARFREGEVVPDSEIRRELEMVGLREKRGLGVGEGEGEGRRVGWREMVLGRKGRVVSEKDAEEEWRDLVKAATEEVEAEERGEVRGGRGGGGVPGVPEPAPRSGVARRAESAQVFL